MPTESGKPLIVISYAHADEPEKPAEGEVKWLSYGLCYRGKANCGRIVTISERSNDETVPGRPPDCER